MNPTFDNSIFLQKTGISAFTLANSNHPRVSSGSSTGNNDGVERILIRAGISIADPVSFRHFLVDNPQASVCMIWLPRLLKSRFGNDGFVNASIEILNDPEDIENAPELYVVVDTSLSVEEANERLSHAISDLIEMGEKAHKVNLVLNYV